MVERAGLDSIAERHLARVLFALAALGLIAILSGCTALGLTSDTHLRSDTARIVDLTPDHQRAMTKCFLNTQLACGPTSRARLLTVSLGQLSCRDPLKMIGYCLTRSGLSPRAITLRRGVRLEDAPQEAQPEQALVIRVRRNGKTWLKVMTAQEFDDCEVLEDQLRLDGGCRPA